MAKKTILEIDGVSYDVVILSIKESVSVLYSDNTGRTASVGARMSLDPLGTFYNHEIVVKRKGSNVKAYDDLFDYVTQPRYDGFHIKAVHNQSIIEYDAYISAVERELHHIDEKKNITYWKEMTLKIIAMEAQVLPK